MKILPVARRRSSAAIFTVVFFWLMAAPGGTAHAVGNRWMSPDGHTWHKPPSPIQVWPRVTTILDRPPCCFLEREIKYDQALKDAWVLSIGKQDKEMPADYVNPSREVWTIAFGGSGFDTACSLALYDAYKGEPTIVGPNWLMHRLDSSIRWAKKKLENCDPRHSALLCPDRCEEAISKQGGRQSEREKSAPARGGRGNRPQY